MSHADRIKQRLPVSVKVDERKPTASTATSNSNNVQDILVERLYSVSELAEIWRFSRHTIRRIFENEPGVLKWGVKERRFKRRYTTLRIPESVALRVYRQMQAAG